MIRHCTKEEDIKLIIEYMGNRYYEAIYLYMDLKRYGLNTPNVDVWVQTDEADTVLAAALKYHNGMHIFSKQDEIDGAEWIPVIQEYGPTIICAEARIIRALEEFQLPGYWSEFGFVAKYQDTESKLENAYEVYLATEADYDAMADMLMLDDDIGASYTRAELKDQIRERIEDGFSRSYCVSLDDRIVAQASTGAEDDVAATISYVMTDENYRQRGLSKSILKTMCEKLTDEGKEIYLIYYSEVAGRLYLNNGFSNVCNYGKLYLNVEE